MDFFNKRGATKLTDDEDTHLPAPKRISTPAGKRLSVVMDNPSHNFRSPKRNSRLSGKSSTLSNVTEHPHESSEFTNGSAGGYSYSIFSDKSAVPPEKPLLVIEVGPKRRKGWWKKLAIYFALFVVVIVAVAVGMALGLKKKSSGG